MRAVGRRDTAPELAVRRLLHARGLRYRVDFPLPLEGVRRRADIAFPRLRLAVFVDGCWWHGCTEHKGQAKSHGAWWHEKIGGNIARDRDTDRRLDAAGWATIRAWEHEEPVLVADRVARVVERLAGEADPGCSTHPAAHGC